MKTKIFTNNLFSLLEYNNKRIFLLFFIISSFIFSSCKTQKKIILNKEKEICLLDYKSPKILNTHLKKNEFNFNNLSIKLSAEAQIDSSAHSFTATLRMKKDSVIWLSLSKLGIEGARAIITKDSVKFINRLESTYFCGDYSYISKLLNTDLDFDMLQSLLIGNSVSFYDEEEKLKSGVDNCHYYLGTIRKRKIKKAEKGKALKEPSQTIYLMPESYKISHILFFEFNPDRSFEAVFTDFKIIDSISQIPQILDFKIKAQKKVNIQIKYNKIALDEEMSFPFKIPEKYEKADYKEKQ